MKIVIIVIVFVSSFLSHAQNASKKIKVYKVLIITETERINGFLYSADSLGITITQNKRGEVLDLMRINGQAIKKIKIGRKGQVSRGALIGALSGAAIGYLVGFASGDDDAGWFAFSKEEKALYSAITFAPVGAIVGTLIGTSRKRIKIDFNTNLYLQNLMLLKSYSLQNEGL